GQAASYKAVISINPRHPIASAEKPEAALLRAGDALGADIVVALRRIGEGEPLGDEEPGEIDAVAVEADRRPVGARAAREAAGDVRLVDETGGEGVLRAFLARQGALRLRAAGGRGVAAGGAAVAARRRADAEEMQRPAADAQGGGAGGDGGAGDLRPGLAARRRMRRG